MALEGEWVKLDLLALMFPNLPSVALSECRLDPRKLGAVALFIHKLQSDPGQAQG